MDTRPTPEQAELRRAADRLVNELRPATVAALDDDARAKRLAAAVRDAGWLELRHDSGAGAPLASGVEAAIVAEALGAGVADVAFSGPVLAADLLRRAGIDTAGVAAIAVDGYAIDCEGVDDVYVLDGPTLRRGAERRANGGDARRRADLTRSVVDAAPGDVVATLSDAEVAAWTALGLALTSADLVGVMRVVLGVTVEYAKERRQFGVPVGSFQAVQHLLAEAHCLYEGSVSVAAYAAWSVDALDPDAAVEAGRVAKAYCTRAARTVCETAIQAHGGIGNTWDCMVHVYLRRALLSAQWFGDDGVQLAALGVSRGLS